MTYGSGNCDSRTNSRHEMSPQPPVNPTSCAIVMRIIYASPAIISILPTIRTKVRFIDMEQSSRTSDVGKLLLVSLLVMLNLTLIFVVNTRIDHYSLYTLHSLEPILKEAYGPYALFCVTLAINCTLAFGAHYLYKWLRRGDRRKFEPWDGVFYRHTFAIGAPVAMAMLPGALFTGNIGKPFSLVVGCLLIGALSLIAACKDERINISSQAALFYLIAAAFAIGILVTATIQWLFALHGAEQIPETSNTLWQWQVNWEVLGYPPDEFAQRFRGSMLIFTVSACAFMVIAVGFTMLHALVGRMEREGAKRDNAAGLPDVLVAPMGTSGVNLSVVGKQDEKISDAPRRTTSPVYPLLPEWGVEALTRLGWRDGDAQEHFIVFDGATEIGVTANQYERLLIDKEHILSEAGLIVNKASYDAYSKVEGRWERLRFRSRKGTTHGLSGPFSLLCVCARNPGHRLEAHDLRYMLESEMQGRGAINVSDFRNQLMTRQVKLGDGREVRAVPLEYDGRYTFIREGVKVCFIYDNER